MKPHVNAGWLMIVMLGMGLIAALFAPRVLRMRNENAAHDAYVIAENHLQQISCGYVDAVPRDTGRQWAFTAYTGYVPTLDPNLIFVDKKTGTVSWAGPTIPK